MKVTYQGVAGAYSHIAAKEIFPGAEYIACETFEQASKLVEDGSADYAVLPIQNSNAGRVDNMYKLLPDIKLKAVGEHFLRIRHQLIGLPSATLEEINGALSHPQALMQCSSFLRKHNIESITYIDTAKSCEEILKLNDTSKAGIASVLAAEIYSLKILSPNIENAENNTTRFVVWKKDNQAKNIDNCEIISLCLFKCKSQELPAILSVIKENQIKLQRIESYTKNSFSPCCFYIEINSVSPEQKHLEVMKKIEKHTTEFTCFGTFESKKAYNER